MRLPSGNPLFGVVLKLVIIWPRSHSVSLSSMWRPSVHIRVSWSMEAKNFLMSHFKTKHCLVLFFEIFLAKHLNLSRALCVPLFSLQEYESEINFLSKLHFR